jgi:hypothetical protein
VPAVFHNDEPDQSRVYTAGKIREGENVRIGGNEGPAVQVV